jgi:hypothetical protein
MRDKQNVAKDLPLIRRSCDLVMMPRISLMISRILGMEVGIVLISIPIVEMGIGSLLMSLRGPVLAGVVGGVGGALRLTPRRVGGVGPTLCQAGLVVVVKFILFCGVPTLH